MNSDPFATPADQITQASSLYVKGLEHGAFACLLFVLIYFVCGLLWQIRSAKLRMKAKQGPTA